VIKLIRWMWNDNLLLSSGAGTQIAFTRQSEPTASGVARS